MYEIWQQFCVLAKKVRLLSALIQAALSHHDLSIQFEGPVSVNLSLPQEFYQERIPGSEIYSITETFGSLNVQSITAGKIRFHYITGTLAKPVFCVIKGVNNFLCFQIVLSGDLTGYSVIKTYQFTSNNHFRLLYFPERSVSLQLPSQPEIRAVVIAYPVAIVQSVLSAYPWLEELNEDIRMGNQPVFYEQKLDILLSEKVFNLLHTPYAPATEKYFQKLFSEILDTALSEYKMPEKGKPLFSQYDISCIYAAKEYIDANLLERITIAQLARKVGINQLKLKKGFKEVYGIGLYGYRLQQRLLIAKVALEKTTKPIHQIARQAGYKNSPNFSASFKNRYSITPYQYRDQHRRKKH